MATRKSKIIGLSWKKLADRVAGNGASSSESDYQYQRQIDSRTPRRDPLRERSNNQITDSGGKKLKRTTSFRKTLGTIKQKLKKSTSRKRDLAMFAIGEQAYSELESATSTPVRRSPRIAAQQEEKLYSPFCIDTPGKTPIRMGTHQPKRCNFSSPATFQRDLDEVNTALQSLHQINSEFEEILTRQSRRQTIMVPQPTKIRTVPVMGAQTSRNRRRSCQPKPVFV